MNYFSQTGEKTYKQRTDPRESNTADGVRQHVSEDRRKRVACWKVGVEPWMLPVCYLYEQTFKWFSIFNECSLLFFYTLGSIDPKG